MEGGNVACEFLCVDSAAEAFSGAASEGIFEYLRGELPKLSGRESMCLKIRRKPEPWMSLLLRRLASCIRKKPKVGTSPEATSAKIRAS